MKVHACMAVLLAGVFLASPGLHAQQLDEQELQVENLSPEEQLQFADMALQEMQDAVQQVSRMLEAAEKERDPVRIQCLSKKLTTMRALLEVSQASATAMKQAIEAGDTDRAQHEYRKIAIALAKVRQFRAEADTCGGGSGAKSGTTEVELLDVGASTGEDIGEALTFEDSEIYDKPPSTSRFE